MYTHLALDIDGTLTRNDKTISPRVLDTLLRAQQQGLKLILATGRPTNGVAAIADQLRMEEFGGYVLSFNGGRIHDWRTKELLYQQSLPDNLIPYIYKCTRCAHEFVILSYCDGEIITEAAEYPYVMHASFINKMPPRQVHSFVDEVKYPLPKCLIVGEPEPLHQLELEMQRELTDPSSPLYPNRIGVYRSEPFFLEVVPANIDKAQCLDVLLHKIGAKQSELIACGDGFNDITMIRYAGLGIAMANAQQPVKDIADAITLSNEEDGVAAVVEKYFFHTT